MKRGKKILLSFVMGCLLVCVTGIAVSAEEGIPYKYTVTLSAGNKGTINGESKVILTTELSSGGSMTLDVNELVTVTDDRYYVKGIRLSGRDNAEAQVSLDSPYINGSKGDQDFVVAYGMKGNMVAYTVNYQDAAGNQLMPSRTLYGNIGDKPVVAYHYIENFVPRALAMTKTLGDNGTDNVFTFVYTPGAAGTATETTGGTVTIVEQTAAVPNAGTIAGTGEGAAAGTAEDTGAGTETGTATDTQDAGTETTEVLEEEEVPRDLVDLDEEETPKSDVKLKESTTAGKAPIGAAIAMIVVAAAALVTLIVVVRKKRGR